MNRTYRLVFNKALGLVQVVSELANCRGKKSSGRSTVSGAHTGFSENLSAPFKLKAISIASALTVGSLLIIASPSSFAETFDNTSGNLPTLTTTVGITGGAGTNGAPGYNGDDGGSGENGINNTSGTIGTITNNVTITGGAGGAGGAGDINDGRTGGGGDGGAGIYNVYGTIGTLSNNVSITGGNGGEEGAGWFSNRGGGDGGAGIYNVYGTLTNLNNTGSITGGTGGAGRGAIGGRGGVGIENYYGTLTNLNNTGSITGGAAGGNVGAGYGGFGADAISNAYGTITNLTNNGSITGSAGGAGRSGYSPGEGLGGGRGIDNDSGTIATLNNNGSITGGAGGVGGSAADGGDRAGPGAGGSNAIENGYSTITTLNNNGSITGGAGGDQGIGTYGNGSAGSGGKGMNNGYFTTITTLNNNGSITGGAGGAGRSTGGSGGRGGNGGVGLYGYATITTLNNFGSITGGSGGAGVGIDNNGSNGFGIENFGSIEMLNNAQGGDGLTPAKTALTYVYFLPTNYNIIINSLSHYGQIAFSTPYDTTTFGISSLSGSNIGVAGTRYENVISGVNADRITNENTELNYQNGNQSATYKLVADVNTANTWDLLILSMISGPSATDTQASLQSLAPKLRGAFSSQAIATNFANMNTYDCSLFDAKGVCVSVGGQQTYVDNPSSNMTSTVVVAGYKVSPNIRIGGFLNQNINNNTVSGVHISNANPMMGVFAVWNQKEDRLGYQVKIANAYQDKDVTTTRDVIDSAEAGTGRTTLNTQSYVGELSYAFMANEDKTLVRPYAALRYTSIKQDGYTEQTSAGVTAPLTYAALADRSTTALLGVKLNHKLAEKVNLTGSLGIEQDLHHQVDNLTATGIAGLTSENFNDSIKRTRPVASIGAYYMPVKNQRISADLYYQQMPFQSTGSATAYVNYTIGF